MVYEKNLILSTQQSHMGGSAQHVKYPIWNILEGAWPPKLVLIGGKNPIYFGNQLQAEQPYSHVVEHFTLLLFSSFWHRENSSFVFDHQKLQMDMLHWGTLPQVSSGQALGLFDHNHAQKLNQTGQSMVQELTIAATIHSNQPQTTEIL